LERHLSKIQEEQGHAVISLHKKIAKHVRDMHTWKDYLEQDKEYDSIDLHITMAEDLKTEMFEEKVKIVNDAFSEETSLLSKLLNEKNGGASSNLSSSAKTDDGSVSPRGKKTGKSSEKSEKSEKSERSKK